jgi:hypothetical protein
VYKKVFIGAVMFLTFLILVSCRSSQSNKELPVFLPISQKDISEIRLWGNEKGTWQDGRILTEEESANIIKWVNRVENFDTIKLPPEMKPPQAEITVYFLNKKTIQIFPWGNDLVMSYSDSDPFKIEQQDLKNYISERLK